ncbi:MAG: SprT-like domain-containing protein [Muribaculaceae bacterium]|nr:SprT-like domain-containing protein [Muribaculaceae bacterium]
MIPDLVFVNEAFKRFNREIFEETLPVPRFRMTHARTFRGKLCYRVVNSRGRRRAEDFEMRISLDFDLPQEEWEDVVIHEMIHLHIAHHDIKDSSSHGPKFRAMMADINRRHGRRICVTARSTKEELDKDKRVRGHYLCIVRFNDGRLGVAPVAKSRIFELWDSFSAWPEVSGVSWIGTVDTWFNRFPRVMKTKVYITSRDELLQHLKGAMRLERTIGGAADSIKAVSVRCNPEELLP